MNQYDATTGGSPPTQRITFRPALKSKDLNAHVKNLTVSSRDVISSAGEWCSSIVYYEPSIANFTFDGCKFGRFEVTASLSSVNGLTIPSVAVGDLYTGSGNVTKNLRVTNCSFEGIGTGIRCYGGDRDQFTEMKITGSSFYDNNYYGIYFFQTGVLGGHFDVTVSNNTIYDNESIGILIAAEAWRYNSLGCTCIVTGNHVYNNNPSGSAGTGTVQIQLRAIGSGTATSQQVLGVCSGNSCKSIFGVYTPGRIQVNVTNVGPAETAIGSPSAVSGIRGVETGHDTASGTQYLFANTYEMINNDAVLTTP